VRGLLGAVAAALVVGAGCGDPDVGALYRAERDFQKVQREARRLSMQPDLTTPEEMLGLAVRFEAIGRRYLPGDGVATHPPNERRRRIEELGVAASLFAARYYLQLDEGERGRTLAESVRSATALRPELAMRAQAVVVDALLAAGEHEEALDQLWSLAEDYPLVDGRTGELHTRAFNAPIEAVRLARAGGDSAAVQASVDRALAVYVGVRAAWRDAMPALSADLHRAALLQSRGQWRQAVELSEAILASYPDSVLRPEVASRVELSVGRLLFHHDGDGSAAERHLLRARELAPGTDPAHDAAFELADLATRQGNIDEAVARYRLVVKEAADDGVRAPVAMFRAAETLQAADRWEEALSELRTLRATYPRSAAGMEVPFILARHHRESGEPELEANVLRRAEEELEDLIAATTPGHPEHALAYRNLIRSRTLRQDWAGAVASLVAFAEAMPGRPEAAQALLDAAGLSREQVGDSEQADVLLRRVEAQFPESMFAETARRMRGENAATERDARAGGAPGER
jgi:TolA-binding protein